MSLEEEFRVVDLGLLSPFYVEDAEFDGSSRRSAQLLKMLMERGVHWGYLPNPTKLLFIVDTPGQEEVAKR